MHARSDNVDRHTLPPPERAPTEAAERPAASAPANAGELQLLLIWEEVLGQQGLNVQDNFFEVGGNSLLAAHLFALIEQRTGRKLPLATLFRAPTVARLAQVVWEQQDSQSAPASWSSLVPIQPHGTRPPFFCVHAESGSVRDYHELMRGLGPDQPFYGLQARGLNGEEVGEPSYESMAAAYLREIRTVQPHGPYYLGGYCLGGDIAFEMAQQLKAEGEDTAVVLMIENTRPCYREQRLPGITALHRLYYKLLRMIDLELIHLRVTHADRRMAYVGERLRGDVTKVLVVVERCLDALLSRFGVAMLHSEAYMLANLVQKHNQAYVDYQPRPYDGRVVIVRARRQRRGSYPDPMLGWGRVLTGEVQCEEVDGPPLWGKYYGEQLARRIGSCLETAQQSREATEPKETAPAPSQIAVSSA